LIQCGDDSEETIYSMFASYWSALLARHKRLIEIKKAIAAPIFAILQRYSEAHCSFVQEWIGNKHDYIFNEADAELLEECFNESSLARSYWTTPFGMLTKALNRLVHQMDVFSFYG